MNGETSQLDFQLLTEVREKAIKTLADILPLIEGIEPTERFTITLNALRSTNNMRLLQPALDAALRIENKEDQASSLLELINETDFLMDQSKPSVKTSSSDSGHTPIVVK